MLLAWLLVREDREKTEAPERTKTVRVGLWERVTEVRLPGMVVAGNRNVWLREFISLPPPS